jgi:hypothetical protein
VVARQSRCCYVGATLLKTLTLTGSNGRRVFFLISSNQSEFLTMSEDALMKDAGIPTRIINVAINTSRKPMTHLSHLASFTKRELLLEPNCGSKTLKQAEAILAAHGFSFAASEKKTRKITTHEEKLIERIEELEDRVAYLEQALQFIRGRASRPNIWYAAVAADAIVGYPVRRK